MKSKAFRTTVAATLLTVVIALAFYAIFGGRAALDGTSWRLVGWPSASPTPPSFTITARFDRGQIGGNSAVNSYGGPYRTGLRGSFSVGPINSTLIAGPEDAMRAEQTYFELLGQARHYSRHEDELTLSVTDRRVLLIFRRTQ